MTRRNVRFAAAAPCMFPEQISFVDDKKFQGFASTPGCPPCGVTGNKRHLHSGNANPAPSN